jgi:hypothetical protein
MTHFYLNSGKCYFGNEIKNGEMGRGRNTRDETQRILDGNLKSRFGDLGLDDRLQLKCGKM